MANPALCEVVKDVRDQLVGFEIDEAFFSVMLQCLKSLKFPPKLKLVFASYLLKYLRRRFSI